MTEKKILLDHGSGGRISQDMVSDMILPLFDNPALSRLDDGARIEAGGQQLAFSTDSYVVDPIFFPGGNIGDLAVNGTVNDVAMCGACPLCISAGLIIEEGLAVTDLERILSSMARAAEKAGVPIVTGDTKVVPKGKADKIFINTAGVGLVARNTDVSGSHVKPGDSVIISGSIADHGITVLSAREGLHIDADIQSDSAPLNHMVSAVIESGAEIHALRDPTRGGLGTLLNEIALQSNVGITIKETRIPVKSAVMGVCELLGFDPLHIANEGKLAVFAPGREADRILEILRKDEFGREAAIIGEVSAEDPGRVFMETVIGGTRIVDMLSGEQLPRIC